MSSQYFSAFMNVQDMIDMSVYHYLAFEAHIYFISSLQVLTNWSFCWHSFITVNASITQNRIEYVSIWNTCDNYLNKHLRKVQIEMWQFYCIRNIYIWREFSFYTYTHTHTHIYIYKYICNVDLSKISGVLYIYIYIYIYDPVNISEISIYLH